jgi:ribosomal protein S26
VSASFCPTLCTVPSFTNSREPSRQAHHTSVHAEVFQDRLCGLVVRVPRYITEMYCVSCEVRTEFIYVMLKKVDRLCGLVVRVPGYITEMYCVSCEVRTEFIYVMLKKEDRLCGLVARDPGYITEMYCVSCEVRTEFIYVM